MGGREKRSLDLPPGAARALHRLPCAAAFSQRSEPASRRRRARGACPLGSREEPGAAATIGDGDDAFIRRWRCLEAASSLHAESLLELEALISMRYRPPGET